LFASKADILQMNDESLVKLLCPLPPIPTNIMLPHGCLITRIILETEIEIKILMKLSMTGQDKGDLLIQVIA
jgi:hypothetical protein